MEQNKEDQIKYAIEELVGKGNLAIVDETFTTDYVAHAGEKEYSGHSFIKRFANQLRTAIPDIQVVDVKFLAQDANTIVWQRTLRGTHKVAMQGIPPSGKKVKWVDMIVTRFNNEKIAEEWVVSELMGELLLKVPLKEMDK
jgi:predicted ester cyclase